MLISVCSSKGAPGVTSTALVLAAVWPRPVVMVEADPTGGDLAFRCRSANGGPLSTSPSLLSLAAAVRDNKPGTLVDFAQDLACGVPVVQGVPSGAQGRALKDLWPSIAQACRTAGVDVIADLGRLDRTSPTLPLAAASDRVLVVGIASLESVIHTRETLLELGGEVGPDVSGVRLVPTLVGLARHAKGDRDDVDRVLAAAGALATPCIHLPLDRPALRRLEGGDSAGGRLGRATLIREARIVAADLAEPRTATAAVPS